MCLINFKRYFAYALLVLISLSLVFVIRNWFINNRSIDERTAIERAQLYCGEGSSPSQEPPHNIKANLLTCGQAGEQTTTNLCERSSTVWVVSIDGLWFHQGPPNADGSKSIPIPLHTCSIFMDAETADMIEMQS